MIADDMLNLKLKKKCVYHILLPMDSASKMHWIEYKLAVKILKKKKKQRVFVH